MEHRQATMDKVGQTIRVMVVDDHSIVRKGVKAFLGEYDNIAVVAEAADGLQAIPLVEKLRPDVVILDLLMPGMDGIETVKGMLAIQPNVRIILLTADYREDRAILAIQAGAYGYVRKDASPEELIISIQKVYQGEPTIKPSVVWKILSARAGIQTVKPLHEKLSERETEVLRYLTQGYSDAKIAEKLFLTDVTIRTHVSRIIQKLGVRNRVEAALYSLRFGLVQLEDTSVDLHN